MSFDNTNFILTERMGELQNLSEETLHGPYNTRDAILEIMTCVSEFFTGLVKTKQIK
jgi:hypothetical protein